MEKIIYVNISSLIHKMDWVSLFELYEGDIASEEELPNFYNVLQAYSVEQIKKIYKLPYLSVDPELSKDLHVYDIISADCLIPSVLALADDVLQVTLAFIEFLNYNGICFIVASRSYTKDSLDISCVMTANEFVAEIQSKLIGFAINNHEEAL